MQGCRIAAVQLGESMKIGLIGAGAWGQNHLRVWKRLGDLAVVCEADDARRNRLHEEHPDVHITPLLRDLTGDAAIQGVVVATPAETHFRLGRECLLAGKDVFIEKPLALTIGEGEELVKLAREQKRVLWSDTFSNTIPLFSS